MTVFKKKGWLKSWRKTFLGCRTFTSQRGRDFREVRGLLSEDLRVLASLVSYLVENPPAVQESWVRSLGWEDPLEEGRATHSSILAWRIP